MKNIFYSLAIALCVSFSLNTQAESRTWTNSKGKTIEGELISKTANSVKVKLSTGSTATLKLKDLSDEDKSFVESWTADSSADRSTAKASDEKEDSVGAKTEEADNLKFKWEKSYKSALNKAKEYNLPLMILFTGEKWCGYCVKLDQEYFSKKEFNKGMGGKAIGLKIISATMGQWSAKDKDLIKRFDISGVPTIVYLSPDGTTVLGTGGYYAGSSPEAYVKTAEDHKAKVRASK